MHSTIAICTFLKFHPSAVIQLLWLANKGQLLSLCSDDTIYLWEVNSTSFPPHHFFFVRSRKALWRFCSSSGSTVSGSPPCPPPSSQSGFLLGRRRGTRTSSTSTTSASPATSSTGTRPSGCTSPPTRAQSPTCWVSISANCHPSCFPSLACTLNVYFTLLSLMRHCLQI